MREIKTSQIINENWGEYDKTVAGCQLFNWGKIYLHEDGSPIDDEDMIDDLREEEANRKNIES